MRTLDAVSDGRSNSFLATTAVPAVPPGLMTDTITNRIYAVSRHSTVHDDIDTADPSTADPLRAIIDQLKKGVPGLWGHVENSRLQ
jgi:starvation-inducible DNA-binding protein